MYIVQLFQGWKDPWATRAAKGGNDVRMGWLARPIENAAAASKLVSTQLGVLPAVERHSRCSLLKAASSDFRGISPMLATGLP